MHCSDPPSSDDSDEITFRESLYQSCAAPRVNSDCMNIDFGFDVLQAASVLHRQREVGGKNELGFVDSSLCSGWEIQRT